MRKGNDIQPLPHSLVRRQAPAVQRKVERRFRKWLPAKTIAGCLYSLEPFTETRPLCYFEEDAIDTCLDIYEIDPTLTLRALGTHDGPITHAVLSLLRGGTSWSLEDALSIQTPKQIAELERTWHPEYQRHIEHIYNNLITAFLEILGGIDGKNYVDLVLANRIQKLLDRGFPELTSGADATIRNAISHGGVRFGHDSIAYRSSKQTVELKPRNFTDHLDELADISSAMVAALLLFVCRNPITVANAGYHHLPLGLRFLLIRGVTRYKGFFLESISESGIGSDKVLNLYCISKTKSRMVHRYDGVAAASQALVYGGWDYDLIAVSIDCGGATPTYSPYKVKEMKAAFRPGAPKQLLGKILDPTRELLWYDASTVARKFFVLKCSVSGTWHNTKDDIVTKWRQLGLDVLSSRYELRFSPASGNKSIERIRRAEGHVVLAPDETPTKELVEKIIRHASRRLRRKLLRAHDITGKTTLLARRPKYVWLKVHSEDGRFRELDARELGSPALIAIGEWIHWRHHGKPIFVKVPSMTKGGHRIRIFVQ